MTHATLADVRRAMTSPDQKVDPKWAERMLHFVPDLPTVRDRKAYLVDKASGKVVLDIGCTGAISSAMRAVSTRYYGVDKVSGCGEVVDLDVEPSRLPVYPDVEVVIASEILEHLSNPGRFLDALRSAYPSCEVFFTVPNAGAYQVRRGTHEMVNAEHVAWYSYTTLKTLLARHGFTIQLARWYHGEAHKAEGLIVRAR